MDGVAHLVRRQATRAVPAAAMPQPLPNINATPLIDVMLVLLTMLIITIPLQTHAVKLDLPRPTPVVTDVHPDKNRLAITAAGGLQWNGRSVDRTELRQRLATSARLQPAPELHLAPDPLAPYAVVDEVLAMTKREQVTRVGFVGNEAYRTF